AAHALVAAHGGNKSAAGRELGYGSQQAFDKWLKRRTAGPAPDAAPHVQEQPARYFCDADDARAALEDWFLAQQETADQVEPLVLGALAAGLTPEAVYRTTGIGLSRTARLRPGHIAVAADLTAPEVYQVLDDTALALTAHAAALTAAVPAARPGDDDFAPPEASAALIWRYAAAAFVRNLAPAALIPEPSFEEAALEEAYTAALRAHDDAVRAAHPGLDADALEELIRDSDLPEELTAAEAAYIAAQQERLATAEDSQGGPATHLSADAWLAGQISKFNRLAAACEHPDRHTRGEHDARCQDAMADAYRQIAAAYLHLRATATVPPLAAPDTAVVR
ncbi:hypothetical protein, partial [Kitasatospora sp. NPDC002965]|uniref:hypothetical protein n=1 Tax=Kitasatospora sp. NPDC002965 TaxID=3154775 RepID=UPI0033A39EF5